MVVTIGDLLGIYNKARAMDWGTLASQLGKASTIKAVTNVVASQTLSSFKTLVSSFKVVQQVNDVVTQARPIITLAAEMGNWTDPAIWPQIGAEAISIVKKLLLAIAISGINQLKSYILGIEIDLGNLTSKNINSINNATKDATNKSYTVASDTIANHAISASQQNIPASSDAFYGVITGISNSITSAINGSVDISEIQSALQILLQDQTNNLINSMYGQQTIPNTGGLPTYNQQSQTIFSTPSISSLVQTASTIDTSVQITLDINTDTVREMLDAIEATIQQDKNNLIGEISNNLNQISETVDSSGLQEADIIILENLKTNFIQATMSGQMSAIQASLDSIFNYDDVALKNILILFIQDYIKQINSSFEYDINQINALIASFPSGMTFSDQQTAVNNLVVSLLTQIPNPSVTLQMVIFQYMASIYSQMAIANSPRQDELAIEVSAYFQIVRKIYLQNLIPYFDRIRLVNQTIEDTTYYSYSYSDMNTSLQNQIILRINTTTVNNDNDFNTLKNLLIEDILSIENSYSIVVSENIPHDPLASIGDKLSILRGNLLNAMKNIIFGSTIPPIDYTQFSNLSADDIKSVDILYSSLFQQYEKSLVENCANIIQNGLDGTSTLSTSDFEYKIYIQYTPEGDQKLKNNLYNQCYFIINNALYSNGTNSLETNLITEVNNFDYIIDYSVAFSSLLKELEISIIQDVINNIGV
jgi:hypothetical protein